MNLIESLLKNLVTGYGSENTSGMERILPLGELSSATTGLGGLLRAVGGEGWEPANLPRTLAGQAVSIGTAAVAPASVLGLLSRLFGREESTAPVERPVRYSAAASLFPELSLDSSTGAVRAFDFDQSGAPRSNRTAGAPVGQAAAPVVIQVQAIDSRSFLDHSDAIASAVRQALLNSHPLSDVITE